MTDEDARARYGQDAEKVDWTRLEVRPLGQTGVLMPPNAGRK